jgi:enamine deaminase RidA (YjgF/YER057c/UK114 family)
MLRSVKVLGRVFVLGRVAAADVPTGHTEAEVDPVIAHLEAFLAAVGVGLDISDLIQVTAAIGHVFPQLICRRAKRASATHRCVDEFERLASFNDEG